jgi:hypothetical protein
MQTRSADLRWITFGHVESDECGSMNQWLAAAPRAVVAHGGAGLMVSLNDLCDRPPHVPHNWEARVLFEETTRTLFCGDLFTHAGNGPVLAEKDIVGLARAGEELFHASSCAISLASTRAC